MSGRIHPKDRRELFWAIPLIAASVISLGYVTRKFVFPHWFTVDSRLWDNPEGIGFLWGALGFLVLIGYALFFWVGLYAHVSRAARLAGPIIGVTMTVALMFGIYMYLVQMMRVWSDEAQRLGYLLGSAWVWVLIGSWKLVGLWLFGHRLNPLRGRFNPKQQKEPSSVRSKPYDGGRDFPAKDAAAK